MFFPEFIENLQSKPEPVRRKIIWLAVFLSTAVIIGIWFWSLNSSFETINKNDKDENGLIIPKDLSQSFSQFKQDVPTLWQSLKRGLENLKEENK